MKALKMAIILLVAICVLGSCAGKDENNSNAESSSVQTTDTLKEETTEASTEASVETVSETESETMMETEIPKRYTPLSCDELVTTVKDIIANPPVIGESMKDHLKNLDGALEDTVWDASSYWYVYYADSQCWYDFDCLKDNFIRQVSLNEYVGGMDGSIEKFSYGYGHTLWVVECAISNSDEAIKAYDDLVEWMKTTVGMSVAFDSREGTNWTTRSQDDFSEVSLAKMDSYGNNGEQSAWYQLTVKRGFPSSDEQASESETEETREAYYIRPLTADELLATVKDILSNPPVVGESMKDHLLKMDGALEDTVSENFGKTTWSVQYSDSNYMRNKNVFTSNFILSVNLGGFTTGMDGTIEAFDQHGGVDPWTVQCVMMNYDEAVRVYDELLAWLQSEYGMVISEEIREGTTWKAEEYNGCAIYLSRSETSDFDGNDVSLYYLSVRRDLE